MLRSRHALLLGCVVEAFLAGCVVTHPEIRTQSVQIESEPPGALIVQQDFRGQRTLGTSPVRGEIAFRMVVGQPPRWAWAGVAAMALASMGLLLRLGFLKTRRREPCFMILISLAMSAYLLFLVIAVRGELAAGETLVGQPQTTVLQATLHGHAPARVVLAGPPRQSIVRLVLPNVSTAAKPAVP